MIKTRTERSWMAADCSGKTPCLALHELYEAWPWKNTHCLHYEQNPLKTISAQYNRIAIQYLLISSSSKDSILVERGLHILNLISAS